MLNIFYTNRANNDATNIIAYLLNKFTQREVKKFYKLLSAFEAVIKSFPELYPVSAKNKSIHRAVLSKQLAVYYRLSKGKITIVAIMDNRMDYSKWP